MKKFSVIVKNKNTDEKLVFSFYNLKDAYEFSNVIINTSEYFISIIETEEIEA